MSTHLPISLSSVDNFLSSYGVVVPDDSDYDNDGAAAAAAADDDDVVMEDDDEKKGGDGDGDAFVGPVMGPPVMGPPVMGPPVMRPPALESPVIGPPNKPQITRYIHPTNTQKTNADTSTSTADGNTSTATTLPPPAVLLGLTGGLTGNHDETLKIHEIPLGPLISKMLTNFGDSPNPSPLVCSLVLSAVRTFLHTAIKDARALRRTLVLEYKKGRESVVTYGKVSSNDTTDISHKTSPSPISSAIMLFKVTRGYDTLSYNVRCGFDIDGLEILYPEEIKAFRKWKICKDGRGVRRGINKIKNLGVEGLEGGDNYDGEEEDEHGDEEEEEEE
jgi:hypothetical protein